MGTYLSPGVYIQEIDTVQPIEGVSTSVTGFAGVTQMGPLDTNPPVLVTSLADYQRTFGGYFKPQFSSTPPLGGEAGYNFLPHAVAGFFNNGGQVLYIKRVGASAANGGTAPTAAQLGAIENNAGGTTTLTTRLTTTAVPNASGGTLYLANMRGIQNGTTLVLTQTKNGVTTSSGTITVESYNDGSRTVNVSGIPAPSPASANFTNYDWQYTTVTLTGGTGINGNNAPLVPAPNTSEFALQASSPGVWGQNILVQITPSSRGLAQAVSIGNYGTGTDNLLLLNSAANMYAGAIIEINTGGSFTVAGTATGTLTAGQQITQPATGASAILIATAAGSMTIGPITGGPANGTVWQESASNYFTPTSATTLPVAVAGGKYYAKIASIQGSGIVLVETPNAGIYASAIPIIQEALAAGVPVAVRTCEFNIAASYGNINESWTGLTLDNTTPYYFANIVNNSSQLLNVPLVGGVLPSDEATQDPSTMPVAIDGLNVNMNPATGSDGSVPIPLDFAGSDHGPGNRTGIASLIDAAEISIIATPGITDQTTQMALIDQCELLKYRFAILDPAPTSTGGSPGIADILNQRNLYDTHYAAIYYPGVVVADPLNAGNPLTVSPSGHIAGIYAQTDAARGVWKAPANVVINGILNLATKLSKGDQDVLNPEPFNINALRDFTAQGRGLRVYGARCITTDTEWMYVNIRRLFIYLEASLDQGTQWAVFEPNNPALWARLTQAVEAFLTTVWQAGGLMGTKASDAFFVKCDQTTMSLDDQENGRLIMQIGVAPVFPAEFVIIQIGQWQGGSSVQEL